MRRRLLTLVALSSVFAMTACTVPASVSSRGANGTNQQVAAGLITGMVKVPSGVIAAGGANVVAAGGGNVIAAGGANFRVAQAEPLPEAALPNTEVFLAGADGEPLPGIDAVKTDDKGQYKFENVPAGHTLMVVAKAKTRDGKDAKFHTLAKSSELGATADVSAATTLVAADVVDGQSELGEFNAAKFKTAVETTKKNLRPDTLPDFGDRAAVLQKMRSLKETVAELKAALDEVRQDLKAIKASLEQLKQQLASRQPGMMQQPGGVMPPPPGGVAPTPADAVKHNFSTAGRWAAESYPVKVAFRIGGTNVDVAVLTFLRPGEVVPGKVPEGKPHDLMVQVAGSTEWRNPAPGFVVPNGAPLDVVLPLPNRPDGASPAPGPTPTPGGTLPQPTSTPTPQVQPTPGQTTGTVATHASVEFSLPQDDAPFYAIKEHYPLTINFNVPDTGGRTVLSLTFADRGARHKAEVPVGVAHNIVYMGANGNIKKYVNFTVPAGQTSVVMPRPADG